LLSFTGVLQFSPKPTVPTANVGNGGIVLQDTRNATLTLPGGKKLAITRQRF
jgi:hypothetical protein